MGNLKQVCSYKEQDYKDLKKSDLSSKMDINNLGSNIFLKNLFLFNK